MTAQDATKFQMEDEHLIPGRDSPVHTIGHLMVEYLFTIKDYRALAKFAKALEEAGRPIYPYPYA